MWHVTYLSPWQESCGSGKCLQYADEHFEVPMLVDSNHLTNKGSALLVRGWVENGLFPDFASATSGQRKSLETRVLWEEPHPGSRALLQ